MREFKNFLLNLLGCTVVYLIINKLFNQAATLQDYAGTMLLAFGLLYLCKGIEHLSKTHQTK